MEIKIPNLGDGIESAVVISVLVSPGDTISKDQTMLELETDKAVAPVPSPAAGVLTSLTVKEGDTVSMGTLIGALEGGEGDASSEPASKAVPESQPVAAPVSVQAPVSSVVSTPSFSSSSAKQIVNENPSTSVSLQALAYRIGLDLRYIQGTGSSGRITEDDVRQHVAYLQGLMLQPPQMASQPVVSGPAPVALPDFSKWGSVDIESCAPLRKKIADKMTQAWQTVPHVTQQLEIDITDIMALRKSYNPKYKKKNAKLTLTVFAIRAVQKALEAFPHFNASYNADTNELIKKSYFHIGIAVDTPHGLIVPVIRDVNKKSLLELSLELAEIAQKAKDRTLGVEELQGGTFTISNLGGLGVGAFTPIINTPEVAILGIAGGELKPVVDKKEKVTYRLKMPVCLSYDHRVIDGADGARFVMEVKQQLEAFNEAELKEI